ncbi:MAG: response regulator [Anaerolineae bacterium]
MAEKIRVLIVDDNEETRYGTQRLLEMEDERIEIVGIAENGLQAIELVRELHPHVVLMDINMPVMDGLQATARITQEMPRVQVVIVSVQDDPNYMRQAIRAGATDFVAKPISADELAAAIERAYQKIPPEVPAGIPGIIPGMEGQIPGYRRADGHIIGVLGPKGGIGKTTVAVNLGVALARSMKDKKVLLIDGNITYGDVAVFLNTRGQYSVVDLAIMLEDPEQADDQVLEGTIASHDSGLKLLVAPTNPNDTPLGVELFGTMLDFLKREFDYIIVDTATTIDNMMVATIRRADRLIMLTHPTMPALKNARLMFAELRAAEYPFEHLMLVMNRVPKNNRITVAQISQYLGQKVVVEIPDDPAADEALNRGVALVTLDPRRVISVQPLLNLAQMLRDSFEKAEEEASTGKPRGLRWFG